MKKGNIVIIAIVVIVIAFVSWKGWHATAPVATDEKTSREVALECTTDMATRFHIHPMLSIVINGEQVVVPANIGITNGCMHPLHTHDTTGKLHVESLVQRDFTLGDFFTVWEKPFDSTHILDFTGEVSVTVNGVKVDTYENTILHDGDEIIIVAGKK